jgi:hypothetical protein
MPLNPPTAGQDLTAGRFSAALDITRTAWQTSDQIVNNTNSGITFVSSPDLILSVVADAVYTYEATFQYDTSSTADFKHNMLVPVGTLIAVSVWGSDTSASSTGSAIVHDMTNGAQFFSGGVAAGTVMTLRPTGMIFISSASGNLQIQFAQNTASATNTILKTGSWIRLTQVG